MSFVVQSPNLRNLILLSIMRRVILPHLLPKYVRALRVAAWNLLFVISVLLLIALVGEVYLRLTKPFLETNIPFYFVDGVGLIRKPNSEARYANWHEDIYVASRINSYGFIDREPVSAERAAAGCHIAFIGDSFVEAREVSIADKFHVRLEEMAARELPRLDITTQAYGMPGTGQINQLPFYDEYARRLNPKLVALVFFINDFFESSTALMAIVRGVDPDSMPYMTAQRDARGDIALRPPDSEFRPLALPILPSPWQKRAWGRLVRVSYFAKWLDTKNLMQLGGVAAWRRGLTLQGARAGPDPRRAARAAMIAERPCCASILDGMPGWQPERDVQEQLSRMFSEERLPPGLEETLEYTAFGIEQFKRRADRDGAALVILAATDRMGTQGDPQFERLSAIAEPLGIPVISQYDYVVRQGHDYQDYRWRTSTKWNATGHQRTAEAIMKWLEENQEVCD